jgi:hypothetical protein
VSLVRVVLSHAVFITAATKAGARKTHNEVIAVSSSKCLCREASTQAVTHNLKYARSRHIVHVRAPVGTLRSVPWKGALKCILPSLSKLRVSNRSDAVQRTLVNPDMNVNKEQEA